MKMSVYRCMFIVVCGLLFISQSAQGVSVEIIKPQSTKSGPEVAIIIIPGSEIPGNAYRGLGLALQANSSFKIWVALTEGYPSNFATYPDVEAAVSLALKSLRSAGASVDKTFIAGHSLGGILAQDYGSLNREKFKGVLLFGSYLPKWKQLAKFPLPVLTISGDLDGMTRVTRLVDTFQELAALDVSNRFSKPIVIVPEMNHGHFVDPPLTPNVKQYDIKSKANRSLLLVDVSNYVNYFMVVVLGQPKTETSKATKMLTGAFKFAKNLFEPLESVKALDENKSGMSLWSIQAQELAAGVNMTVNPEIEIENTVMSAEELVKFNARVEDVGLKVKVRTFTHLSVAINCLDRSLDPVTPLEMMVKMVSQDSVKEKLPDAHFYPPRTCKQINEEALQLVLNAVSTTALERWQTRSRSITWDDDVQEMFEDDWFNTLLNMTDQGQDGGLDVTSVSWTTALNSWPFPFAGEQYCKLISPFRILEWIYVDSLRDTEP